ncbi:MAG: DUF5703 domain-containing protein [Verrucomicrobiota bacterium]
MSDPAFVAYKRDRVENVLIPKYHCTWQMIDLGELWLNDTPTAYSHPSDNVYRKFVNLRNYMTDTLRKTRRCLSAWALAWFRRISHRACALSTTRRFTGSTKWRPLATATTHRSIVARSPGLNSKRKVCRSNWALASHAPPLFCCPKMANEDAMKIALVILTRFHVIAAILLPVGHLCAAPDQAWLDSYNIVWSSQSMDARGSMPIGAGNIGLNVWVEKDELLIYFGSPDSWSYRGKGFNTQMLTKPGRLRLKFSPVPWAKEFRQELELASNSIVLSGKSADGHAIQLRVWIDAMQPVVHIEGQSESPLEAAVAVEFPTGPAMAPHNPGQIYGLAGQRADL